MCYYATSTNERGRSNSKQEEMKMEYVALYYIRSWLIGGWQPCFTKITAESDEEAEQKATEFITKFGPKFVLTGIARIIKTFPT